MKTSITDEIFCGEYASRIPDGEYALYGTGAFASQLIYRIHNEGRTLPICILERTPKMNLFGGIPVKDIITFRAGSMPIVLGSPIYQRAIRDSIIRHTRGYNILIDLFASGPKHDYKVFCIGRGKTGTTSLAHAFCELGYTLGEQADAELLLSDWACRDFKRIIEYCSRADAFQDIPFALNDTYQVLDAAFPRSKFILTVRDSSQEWFNSLVQFHSKKFASRKGMLPTEADLQCAEYRYKGFLFDAHRLVYGKVDMYDREYYMADYEQHNACVMNYFRNRPNDLLLLNVKEKDAYGKLCVFLGKPVVNKPLPWKNKTSDI